MLDVGSHVTGPVTIGNGNEVAVATRDSIPGVIDTVREHPGMVTARASHARLALTGDALILAADAANSVNATNSLEKMLVHQLAASHRLGMKFIDKAGMLLGCFDLGLSGLRSPTELQAYSVEAARLANAGARMMSAYTDALLALDRVRRGGKQTVKVIHQHVAVGPGGQAVVAGSMQGGAWAGERRGRNQNGRRTPCPAAVAGSRTAIDQATSPTLIGVERRPGPETLARPLLCLMVVAGCTAALAPGLGPKKERPGSAHRARNMVATAKPLSRGAVRPRLSCGPSAIC